ncbi:similar to Thioredoxin domain containing protein 6 (Thioredoxin-like protein 2) (predicted), isoform CRA_a [Rattus norvegicus]|uniref:Similar to Thioredoxin domain containing protein 6 (Thioredoxin-like protein 2) (Predicted), isoform CRA_a n=1 Tax=Rattus norvegicus TaxID=10116 RepID=A6I2D8_RAT|nr:similar to Thioredoxin domain containing protein 6 (Thioredoxin-like protein 2) (predicted), isoform CRA_a [Rattus norvegicus]
MVVSSSSLPRAKQSCLLVAGGLATREQSISLQVKQLFLLHPTDPSSLPAQKCLLTLCMEAETGCQQRAGPALPQLPVQIKTWRPHRALRLKLWPALWRQLCISKCI